MDDQNKNLILATVLSFIVIVVWFLLFPPPERVDDPNAPATGETAQSQADGTAPMTPGADTREGASVPSDAAPASADTEEAPRLGIDTPRLAGSINLRGGRIDDLKLKDYLTSLDADATRVTVLRPEDQRDPFYALYGWIPVSGADAGAMPAEDTVWSVEGTPTLTPETPVTMTWENDAGLIFRRTVGIDTDYMFTVRQTVENTGENPVALRPYSVLRRHGIPSDLKKFFVLHEGLIRMSDGELQEESYGNLEDFDVDGREGVPAERIEVQESGWTGFTDHYWMSTIIPDTAFRSTAKYFPGRSIFQTDAVLPAVEIAPGASASVDTRLFAGAKEWETIKEYQNDHGVTRFLDAIDWGWFFFLTKPIFAVLHWLNSHIGNMGWSIIALTVLLKMVLFPLAYKSYASMAKMRELQPEMEKIKERAGDDRQKLQKEMMELYKKEKVNPASGCLPILLQIPIFFSLYKVIFVTLELRHAPWIGWIHDLSAPDPSSILNLFGLLPIATPDPDSFLAIISLGVLPILLGVSMWLQQKLNPAPTDPTQQMIFAWMPWVFMFMLGTFASGLVLYWITNNVITFMQQYAIMRSHGFKPDVFGNIRKSLTRKKKAEGK
ncbi:putative inner membrane protein translocase component YidC [Pseudooceanicola batsensis HTCC2597]|uniref:Membrane protein insertase YidC n=1 Tax=Pseudooceanicola batsensis (strain ATCC BAA-863 / DSM 15984 / KCTC 12145 / HTCC2597) TaxID=252305 RepID=A3TU25_PSEBH|nr:membrane protein insertase YidC [Pseudooceanicola batsensis]EAQ05152.1 putative inner membrane protein translocase component YidC [Pseudooceanicola batsensis HTCC2597]